MAVKSHEMSSTKNSNSLYSDSGTKMYLNFNDSKKIKPVSPYITERRVNRVKTADFIPLSSPYKANSDDFKNTKSRLKKSKKSVLTLPNKPLPQPQTCTVSDMNDSEYFQESKYEKNTKPKKKKQFKNKRKFRGNDKTMAFYDEVYSSELNFRLGCSSSSLIIKDFSGDGTRKIQNRKGKNINSKSFYQSNMKDVWSMVRNINKLQFTASPPMSQDSKSSKETLNINKKSLIRTSQTEELSFISYDMDNNSYSQPSIDRITVIDKQKALMLDNIQNGRSNFDKKSLVKRNTNRCEINKNLRITKTSHVKSEKNYKQIPKPITCTEEKNKINDKRWIKKLNPLSSSRLASHNPRGSYTDTGDDQDLNSLIINDGCKEIVHFNGVFKNCSTDSSKSKLTKKSSNEPRNEFTLKTSGENLTKCVNGITKVVLNKPKNKIPKKRIEIQHNEAPMIQKPKVLFPFTKMTQVEIRRRLANIKFPIVILEKDQLSSSFMVTNYETQFAGLEDQMWPFMVNWYNLKNSMYLNNYSGKDIKAREKQQGKKVTDKQQGTKETHANEIMGRFPLKNNKLIKSQTLKPNVNISNNAPNLCKIINKETHANEIMGRCPLKNNQLIKSQTLKPNVNISNNAPNLCKTINKETHANEIMGRCLLKNNQLIKSQPLKPNVNISNNALNLCKTINKDASTDTSMILLQSNDKYPVKKTISPPLLKYSWASAKRASEFIENIIKKIKHGVYYNQEFREWPKKKDNSTDKAIQADIHLSKNDVCINSVPKLSIQIGQECLKSIPGFEENLTDLKIETFNKNQIAIRHCITNVIVKFDIVSQSKRNKQSKNCIPFKPLLMLENKSKILKCQKGILNTVLPAELCSILPKMIDNIIDYSKIITAQNNNHDCKEIISYYDLNQNERTVSTVVLDNSPNVLQKYNGHFKENAALELNMNKAHQLFKPTFFNETNLLSGFCRPFVYKVNPMCFIFMSFKNNVPHTNDVIVPENRRPICMSVQPYLITNKQMVPAYKRFSLLDMLETFQQDSTIDLLTCNSIAHRLEFKISVTDFFWVNNLSVAVDTSVETFKRKTINFNYPIRPHMDITTLMVKDLKDSYNHNKANVKIGRAVRAERQFCRSPRKDSLSKRHRKCKSASNIGESPNRMLNNVTSLQEFLKILGSPKSLCSVLDKDVERTILSSLSVMKNWITCISPTQALLVLLLATKKETKNLVRYRLLILQGIAVNRITLVSELNMEIEVIEKESFNKLSQFSEMNCIADSLVNHEALLEELIWIAKTTASDYQKPFDECLQRHIRSLLEKRKNLNPSYLRVMARYVGLGLLKNSK